MVIGFCQLGYEGDCGVGSGHLILINYPALIFRIPAIVAAAIFDDLVDGEVL